MRVPERSRLGVGPCEAPRPRRGLLSGERPLLALRKPQDRPGGLWSPGDRTRPPPGLHGPPGGSQGALRAKSTPAGRRKAEKRQRRPCQVEARWGAGKYTNAISRHPTSPLRPPRRVGSGQVRARTLQLVGLAARGPGPWRAEVWGWQEMGVVFFTPSEPRGALGWTRRATGRPGADPTTGTEKDALLQTLRVCGAVLRTRRASPCRSLRQHTRVRTLTRPAPRLVRGRAAPFNPPRPPLAARGQPRTLAGACPPCTLAFVAPSPSASILGGPGADGPRGSPPGAVCAELGPGQGRALAAGQSPATGHGRGRRPACGAPAASSLVLSALTGRLREGLTPPPCRRSCIV